MHHPTLYWTVGYRMITIIMIIVHCWVSGGIQHYVHIFQIYVIENCRILRLVTALSSLKSNNDPPRFLRSIFHSQSPSKSCCLRNRYSVALPRSIRYWRRNFGFYLFIDWKLFRVGWKHVWHKPSDFIDCNFSSIDSISTKYRIVVRLTNQR